MEGFHYECQSHKQALWFKPLCEKSSLTKPLQIARYTLQNDKLTLVWKELFHVTTWLTNYALVLNYSWIRLLRSLFERQCKLGEEIEGERKSFHLPFFFPQMAITVKTELVWKSMQVSPVEGRDRSNSAVTCCLLRPVRRKLKQKQDLQDLTQAL